MSTRLPAEWRLEGRLLHADTGKPVVGMYVRARGESRRWRASAVPVGLTDAEGRFLMRGLAPGTVTIDGLSATHCLPDRVVSSEEFGDAPVTLRVPPPGSLRGRVVGPRGGPAAGVFVDVRRNGRIVAGLRTGLTGEFTMRRVPAGPAELLVRSPDHRPMSQYVFADVPVTNGEVIRREGTAIPIEIPVGRDLGPIRVKARDLVVLGGRAVDPDGRGVAGLKILIRERHVPFWLPVARLDIRNLGRSGPGGLFRVAVPRPIFERDLLCLHRPGLVVTHLQKAGEDLEIRLGRGCRLTARVLDRSRRPLWGRSFRVSPEYNRETHGTWKQRAGFPVETDLDGRFTLPGLPPGEYHLAGPPNLAREIFVIDGDLERDFVLKPR